MLRAFFLLLSCSFAIKAMKTDIKEELSASCPFRKCSGCNNEFKANVTALVSGMTGCGFAYTLLKKIVPHHDEIEQFVLYSTIAGFFCAIPMLYFSQSAVDYYLNHQEWKQRCYDKNDKNICGKSPADKFRRGIYASCISLIAGFSWYYYYKR